MLSTTINLFAENISALYGFVDFVAPVLSQRTKQEKESCEPIIAPFLLAILRANPDADLAKEMVEHFEQVASAEITVDISKGEDGKSVISISGGSQKDFFKATKTLVRRHIEEILLYKSSLMALVSIIEWFIAQLFHYCFKRYPKSVQLADKSLTLAELERFNSVDDARAFLRDKKIEEILRGSIEDWISAIKKHLNLSMSYVDELLPRLIEICQRRNIHVHNGGIVNSIYIANVASNLRTDVSIGQSLPVTREYLEDAIEIFEYTFLLIGFELWKKNDPTDKVRANMLVDIGYDRLCAERWRVAEALNYFLLNDKAMPERLRLIGQVNYWQSIKWQGHFAEIEQEIRDADLSAKEDIFQLARFALLDNVQGFILLLPSLLESGKLKREDLFEWPLFRQIRLTEEYKQWASVFLS